MIRPFGRETPNSILTWNQETFGAPLIRIANRTNLEVAEFLSAVQFEYAEERILEELADVCIMTWAVAAALGEDARPVIDARWLPRAQDWRIELLAAKFNSHYAVFMYNLNSRRSPGYKEIKQPFRYAMQYLEMLIARYSVDIASLVDAKMQINRQRQWKNVEGGNYQHVA